MAKGSDREVTLQDVWELMEFGKPETTSTLTEELSCSKDTVYHYFWGLIAFTPCQIQITVMLR